MSGEDLVLHPDGSGWWTLRCRECREPIPEIRAEFAWGLAGA